MSDPLLRRLGDKIRSLRVDQGISQEILAEKCDLHRTYVGSVERGERNVTILSLSVIARALNVSLSNILEEIEGQDND